MKKSILVCFALMLSISSSFAARNYYEVKVNGQYFDSWCALSGGNCLDEIVVTGKRMQ